MLRPMAGGAAARWGGALRAVAALAAALAVPWALRALAVHEAGRGLGLPDLRGFAADLATSLVVVAVLWPLARVARWLAAALLAGLAVVYYANYETIAALGAVVSPLDLGFLGAPTFVLGSALALRHPLVLAIAVLASATLAWVGLARVGGRLALGALVAGALGQAALAAWPEDGRAMPWRQVNALEHGVRWLALRNTMPSDAAQNPALAMRELVPGLAADLDAPQRLPFAGAGKNVLLVVLESVSGAYLPSAAGMHGREAVALMPRLDRVFDRNVGYATFFNEQRRTNRGLYALLCGELPRLVAGMPKMTVAAARGWQRCLPEILADAGYRTVYLQAAPLAFMLKDRFMPAIGFQEVLGHDWFERAERRTRWGVDDRAFLEQSLGMIETLEASGEPWFLTLLTVGTHHPYVVPDSFDAAPGLPRLWRSFAYLDVAVGEFFAALERSGVRDDTLVLVTSDESAGDLGRASDPLAGQLAYNWGFLAALFPERHRARVVAPFTQSDVPLSVLDYLGLADAGGHLFGRSAFRNYGRGRHLFFGNVNQRTVAGIDPENFLVHCSYEGHRCATYDTRDGRFFKDGVARARSRQAFEALVPELARRSRPPEAGGALTLPLLSDPDVPLARRGWQIVQGMPQVSLRPDDWLEIDLEVTARGEGAAELQHRLRLSRKRKLLTATARIEAGQTLRLRYRFASDLPVPQLSLRTKARLRHGERIDLHFGRRRFTVHHSGERPAQGLQLDRFALAPESANRGALRSRIAPPANYRHYLQRLAAHDVGALEPDDDDDDDDEGAL